MDSPAGADTELHARIRQQEVVADLGQQALETDDLDRLMHDASVAVAETLDNDYCKVLELLPGGDEVFLRQGVGWQEGLVGNATVPTDLDSQAGYTLLSEDPVVVDDLRTEERFSGPDLLVDHDVVSGISVIIGSVESPWGVLGTHTTGQRTFTEHDANFVQSVANILASAITNRQTNHQLHEEERLKTQIVEAVNDGIYVLDNEARFTMVNEAYCEMTGYSRDELLGEHATLVIDEDILQQAGELRTAMIEGQTDNPRNEAELQTATGDRIPVEGTLAMLPTADDTEYQRIGVVWDITERRERERALAESERRNRTLIENFPNGAVGLFDENLDYTAAGGQLMDAAGIAPEDRIGSSILDLYPDDIVEKIEPYFHATFEGEASSFEVEYLDRDLFAQTLPVRNADDDVFAGMLVVQDLTERREVQRELRESEAKFRMLAENLDEIV